MKISLQRLHHPVARRQHTGFSLVALGVGWLCAAAPAAGAETAREPSVAPAPSATPAPAKVEAPAPAPAAQPAADRSYPGTLAAAYAVAPLFALGIGGALSKSGASDEAAGTAAGAMLLAPIGVHLYHDAPDRAAIAFASMLGLTLVGTVGGGIVGNFGSKLSCDPEQGSECEDSAIGATIYGAVIGSVVGYASSAILDVLFRSSAPETEAETNVPDRPARQNGARSAGVWVAPLRSGAAREPRAAARSSAHTDPASADGLLIGVTLRL